MFGMQEIILKAVSADGSLLRFADGQLQAGMFAVHLRDLVLSGAFRGGLPISGCQR